MSMLAWAAGGFLLGLLILAIGDVLNWLATPFTIALHAMFAVEQAKRREEIERRRIELDLQRYSDAMRAFKRGQEQKS